MTGSGDGAYLNAASYGPLPGRARDAIADFHDRRVAATLTDDDLQAPLIASRAAAARLVNAHTDEIALIPNTNVGINIAAVAVTQLGRGRTVLILDREFPANVYPWLALKQRGVGVEMIPADPLGFPQEDLLLERIARGDVGAVSISFVQFSNGFRANLQAIGSACRAHDALFVIDAIQGVGAVPLDVQACHADILACGAQKWLCSPWG